MNNHRLNQPNKLSVHVRGSVDHWPNLHVTEQYCTWCSISIIINPYQNTPAHLYWHTQNAYPSLVTALITTYIVLMQWFNYGSPLVLWHYSQIPRPIYMQ